VTFRFGDQPTLATLDWLRRADAETPGTWLAQPKLDGHRCQVHLHRVGTGKPPRVFSKDGTPRLLPPEILAALTALEPQDDVFLDAEHMGPRGGRQRVILFDLLGVAGSYLPGEPFEYRQSLMWELLHNPRPGGLVELSEFWSNPGLVDRFQEQLTVEGSEGLVIRRASSGLRLGWSRPVDNPDWFKVKFRTAKEA
jgi:ATP-dependent DNA ligase